MKKIPLKQGKFAIVDDEDFIYISRFHWTTISKDNHFYAIREFHINGKNFHLQMWKLLIASENNKEVIYRNGNSLDNRKENLFLVPSYIANHKQAKKTRGVYSTPTSKYKGVCYLSTYAGHKKWKADIVCNGKRWSKHCHTEKEAALFYNEKAREFYGEFAYQNIITE